MPPTRRDRLWLILLILFQVADWTFTLTGIFAFGTDVEGNILFQMLFPHFHWFTVITASKVIVLVGCIFLYRTERFGALKLAAIYYGVAVFAPWFYGLRFLTDF